MQALRDIRKAKGLTMKELGQRVGVSESAISQYETGKREADFKTLLRLGEILNCSIDELIRGKDSKSPPSPKRESGLDERDVEVLNLFYELPSEMQQEGLRYLRYLAECARK